MPHRRSYGLSHRSAPRNDMQKFATCPQNSWALPVYCRKMSLHPLTHLRLLHTLRAPRPCNRRRVTVFCMSLRTSAHTCGNPFSPQGSLASWYHFGQIRNAFRIRPKYCISFCTTVRSADCHVAPLLAMTDRRRMHEWGWPPDRRKFTGYQSLSRRASSISMGISNHSKI